MLHVENITFRIGGRTLFDGASAHIPAGHRVGFVGANGTGKTTLLNLITGRAELDGGAIRVRSKAKVGMVAQVAPDGEQTPLQATLSADRERASLLAEADSASDPAQD
jgi:ATP-binding cassette subfamily F protein 3